MRSIDAGHSTALSGAANSGLVERDLVTFFARHRTTLVVTTFAFWNDLDTVTMVVTGGDDGVLVSRDFVGDGAILSVSEVPNVADLSIQRVQVVFSQIHTTVGEMFRTYDIRLAAAEVHRALFDPQTRNVVGTPYCHFTGQVSLSPLDTPAAGREGGLSIDIVEDTIELTRTNPARRSDETQKRRSNDRMMRYASIAGTWRVAWGEEEIRS